MFDVGRSYSMPIPGFRAIRPDQAAPAPSRALRADGTLLACVAGRTSAILPVPIGIRAVAHRIPKDSRTMIRNLRNTLAASTFAALSALAAHSGAHAAPTLTAASVFSTNSEGNNWNGLFWNTLGKPQEAALSSPNPAPDRWNLYLRDPVGGGFVNRGNDTETSIALTLAPGTYTYALYGESTGPMPAEQHFVLNLYFGGATAAPALSGLFGSTCPTGNCPAGHPNGLDLLGSSGAPEAGAVSRVVDGMTVTLSSFDWVRRSGTAGAQDDVVWPHWANDAPYSNGSGTPDYIGQFTLTVSAAAVPEPATIPMLLGGALAVYVTSRRRRMR